MIGSRALFVIGRGRTCTAWSLLHRLYPGYPFVVYVFTMCQHANICLLAVDRLAGMLLVSDKLKH